MCTRDIGKTVDFVYNAGTDVYEDWKKAGVIDRAKVSRIAFEHAASIEAMWLTTDAVIADKPSDKTDMSAAMGGGMPGSMGGMM